MVQLCNLSILSRRDSLMRVLSGLACSDHSGRNHPWDFLFVSRFQGNDLRRPAWMCGISSNLVEIGPRHPCSAPSLPGMPAWFGHSRVVSEDFKTSLIDWSGQFFLISPAQPRHRASHNPLRSSQMCWDPVRSSQIRQLLHLDFTSRYRQISKGI